jgi:hypothetical protein
MFFLDLFCVKMGLFRQTNILLRTKLGLFRQTNILLRTKLGLFRQTNILLRAKSGDFAQTIFSPHIFVLFFSHFFYNSSFDENKSSYLLFYQTHNLLNITHIVLPELQVNTYRFVPQVE